MKRAVIVLCALLSFPLFTAAGDDYYTKENILRFADHLYQNGEYERAVGEYCRVMALCRDARLMDTLAYRIAVANVTMQKPVSARKYCAAIPADTADSLLGEKAACLYAYSYYCEKKFDSSALVASRTMRQAHERGSQLRCAQIRVGALLQQCRWNEALIEAKKDTGLFGGKRKILF